MKKILFIPLLVTSGCGISTYKSETFQDTTYVPLSIKEQILGYTQGDCADGTLRQRFFVGAVGFADGNDVYAYQYKLIHNVDDTYVLKTRIFKNQIEEPTPALQTGTYEVAGEGLTLENLGQARVELGYRESRMKLEVPIPIGTRTANLHSMWYTEDITNTPLCP